MRLTHVVRASDRQLPDDAVCPTDRRRDAPVTTTERRSRRPCPCPKLNHEVRRSELLGEISARDSLTVQNGGGRGQEVGREKEREKREIDRERGLERSLRGGWGRWPGLTVAA